MKLLAVSQDKTLTQTICTEFKLQGYEVLEASSIKEAEILCKNEHPDVIVADHLQTDGNFFDFYDKLKLVAGKLPPELIIIDDKSSNLDPSVTVAMGAWAFFTKPVSIKTLYSSVEDATFSRRAGYTKRQDERIDLISRLEIKKEHESNYTNTFSTNISFGGFFAAIQEYHVELNEKVDFRLTFSSQEVLEGKGRVAWIRQNPKIGEQKGFGIQFCEGREKYVEFLVPIINEIRTRKVETSTFQEEDLSELLLRAIQAAHVRIAKKLTEIHLVPCAKHSRINCRFPQLLSAFTNLLYELVYPIREIKNSKCTLRTEVKKDKTVDVIIVCVPGGTSFYIDELIENSVQPILDMHNAKILTEFNSLNSIITITL